MLFPAVYQWWRWFLFLTKKGLLSHLHEFRGLSEALKLHLKLSGLLGDAHKSDGLANNTQGRTRQSLKKLLSQQSELINIQCGFNKLERRAKISESSTGQLCERFRIENIHFLCEVSDMCCTYKGIHYSWNCNAHIYYSLKLPYLWGSDALSIFTGSSVFVSSPDL